MYPTNPILSYPPAQTARLLLSAQVATVTTNGPFVDCAGLAPGVWCSIVLGRPLNVTTVAAKLQEASDGASWTDIPGASVPAHLPPNGGSVRTMVGRRTKQYVRLVLTIVTPGSATLPVGAVLNDFAG